MQITNICSKTEIGNLNVTCDSQESGGVGESESAVEYIDAYARKRCYIETDHREGTFKTLSGSLNESLQYTSGHLYK